MAKYNKRIWDSKNKKYIEPDEPKRHDPKPQQLKDYEKKEAERKSERRRLESIEEEYIKSLNERINKTKDDKEAERLIKKRDKRMKQFSERQKESKKLHGDDY